MTNEVDQHPPLPPEESSPQEKLSEIEVPSSPATELNIMTQGNLDRLRETCSFPLGVRTRIPGNGETILSAGDGPGLESGWLYFKARPGKNILKGTPNNIKGWKKRFFFISGDDWEFHPSIPCKEGAVRVLRSWGALGGEAEGNIGGGAATSASDASESSHSKDVPRPEVPSRDDSVEFIRIIGKEMRRILPHIPDLTLLRWSGGKVRDPFLAMSKRIKLSQLAKVVAEKTTTSSSKGVVISEVSEMASKKRPLDDGSKGKQVAPLLEAKKTKTSSGTHVVPARPPIPGEGSTAKSVPGEALGLHALVMASVATAEKILARVILPADKEKVQKLTFDQVVTKFLHVLGQCKGKKAAEEIEARNKEVARLESRVAKLEKSQNLAKGRIIAAFKESEDFQEAVGGSASSYFGNDFDFCKKQVAHQYPNLGIDFDDIKMHQDFLAKVEAEVEEKAAEERGEQDD
ncbi:hypothetical protein Acr_00g0045780 [Actinidia rufa]|uniref:Uncharacterized protein n=1 Tax=Actinidia rufa TaxID=165716 RepID=A0A7J0DJP9_9ERIC|nr:hypothetical protein Acr_00g0045780 [Actinidia rufa]